MMDFVSGWADKLTFDNAAFTAINGRRQHDHRRRCAIAFGGAGFTSRSRRDDRVIYDSSTGNLYDGR